MKWKKILDGEDVKIASSIIEEINNSLSKINSSDSSLMDGEAGISLLHAYSSMFFNKKNYEYLAVKCLENIFDDLNNTPMDSSFYKGFTGIGWTFQHLSNLVGKTNIEENFLTELDLYVYNGMKQNKIMYNYDLFYGYIGHGLYFIERMSRNNKIKDNLKIILDYFEESAEIDKCGITWQVPIEDYINRELDIKVKYNLGLAHGIPSIIAFLSQLYVNKIESDRTLKLLSKTVDWLLSQEIKKENNSSFSSCIFTNNYVEEGSNLGWCYGDLGVSIALLAGAKATSNDDWEKAALRIAMKAANRSLENSGVSDAQFCHGSSGIAHLFNRLYQSTGNEKFKEQSIYWLKEMIKMRKHEKGIAGYLTYDFNESENKNNWVQVHGILGGAAGIALVLLAAISEIEPKWDRFLLLS